VRRSFRCPADGSEAHDLGSPRGRAQREREMAGSKLKARPPVAAEMGRTKAVAFGPPGSGKTWLALSFPSPYYIDTESGAALAHYQERLKASGGVYFGRDEGSLDPATVLDQVEALATEKHSYRTLVIDSVSKLIGTITAREQDRLGDKDAFGASKKPGLVFLRRLGMWLDRLDMNVWLVAHETSKWEGAGNDRREVGQVPDLWEKMVHDLDLTLQVRRIGKGLREATIHKSRLLSFPEADRFYLQKEGQDQAYATFTERWNRDRIEAVAIQVKLASAEDCSRVRALLEVVRIAPEEIERWMAKANVETWEEMTAEQICKVVGHLQAKIPQAAATTKVEKGAKS